jgi:hypothetical protein
MRLLYTGLMLVLLVTGVTALSQDVQHATSAQQCRADLALWSPTLEERLQYTNAETDHINDLSLPNRTAIAKLPLRVVIARLSELGDCMRIDNDWIRSDEYYTTHTFYSGVMHDRQGAFIRRHGFTTQLMREDDEGKR